MNTATKNREVINMEHDMIDTNTHIDTFERSGSITDLGWGKLKNHIFPCLTSPNGIFQAKKEHHELAINGGAQGYLQSSAVYG